MKHNYKITAVLLLVLAFMNACKNNDIDIDTFTVEDNARPTATGVTISGSYSFSGNVNGMKVNIGLDKELGDAEVYDMELERTNFSFSVDGVLIPDTTYYYCYSVDLGRDTPHLTEIDSFATLAATSDRPVVQILDYLPIDDDSLAFRVKCKVLLDGGAEVTERGICYNTFGDPSIEDPHNPTLIDSLGVGTGVYYVYMRNLAPGKRYYVRAYAKNAAGKLGESDGPPLEIKTASPQGTTVEIGVAANPVEGGRVEGGGTYAEGSVIELNAIPNLGYSFDHWQDGNHDNPRTITVTADTIYTAHFSQDEYEITVLCQPVNGGTASVNGTMFNYGETATLTATANDGYEFAGWSDGSTENPHTVTVTGDTTYIAVFGEEGDVYYHLTTHAQPDEGGRVDGGGTYAEGSQVDLLANANIGYHFEKWDDGNTDNPRHITVSADMEFTAIFEKNTYTVTVNASTGGTADGGGQYQYGEMATLTATPTDDCYRFLSWNDGNTDNPRYVTVTGDAEYTAAFERLTYTINVTHGTGGTAHVGSGTGPTSQPVDCGADCTICAVVADEHYEFDKWTEGNTLVSTSATYTYNNVMETHTFKANFKKQTYHINVSANPSNGGTASGGGDYEYNQSCTVTASPNTNSHYRFVNWTDENGTVASTERSYTFPVTCDRNLKANFELDIYQITVNASPADGGMVQINNDPVGSTASGIFAHGTTIQLRATASNGYDFAHWEDNSTNNPRQITVTAGETYIAIFTPNSVGGHEYVDLGLPSGLLWATCNVGADNPEDYGDYFAWGETQTKDDYSWSTYQYCMGSQTTLTKYCNESNCGYNGFTDGLTTLEPSDDAATANWGNGWRMPTRAEFQELIDNTTVIWTTQNGVNGRLFTATNGNCLFLPAAGYRNGTNLGSAGSNGFYWSSSLYTGNPSSAMYFYFELGNYFLIGSYRTYGQSVRAVRSARQN